MPTLNKPKQGGPRKGAGAKPKYGEATEHIAFRVPKSKKTEFKKLVNKILEQWKKY